MTSTRRHYYELLDMKSIKIDDGLAEFWLKLETLNERTRLSAEFALPRK